MHCIPIEFYQFQILNSIIFISSRYWIVSYSSVLDIWCQLKCAIFAEFQMFVTNWMVSYSTSSRYRIQIEWCQFYPSSRHVIPIEWYHILKAKLQKLDESDGTQLFLCALIQIWCQKKLICWLETLPWPKLYICHEVNYFYETEFEILANFGLAGSTYNSYNYAKVLEL